jgi:hypothetical protein
MVLTKDSATQVISFSESPNRSVTEVTSVPSSPLNRKNSNSSINKNNTTGGGLISSDQTEVDKKIIELLENGMDTYHDFENLTQFGVFFSESENIKIDANTINITNNKNNNNNLEKKNDLWMKFNDELKTSQKDYYNTEQSDMNKILDYTGYNIPINIEVPYTSGWEAKVSKVYIDSNTLDSQLRINLFGIEDNKKLMIFQDANGIKSILYNLINNITENNETIINSVNKYMDENPDFNEYINNTFKNDNDTKKISRTELNKRILNDFKYRLLEKYNIQIFNNIDGGIIMNSSNPSTLIDGAGSNYIIKEDYQVIINNMNNILNPSSNILYLKEEKNNKIKLLINKKGTEVDVDVLNKVYENHFKKIFDPLNIDITFDFFLKETKINKNNINIDTYEAFLNITTKNIPVSTSVDINISNLSSLETLKTLVKYFIGKNSTIGDLNMTEKAFTKVNLNKNYSEYINLYNSLYNSLYNILDKNKNLTINILFLRVLYTLKMIGDHGQIKYIKVLKDNIPDFNSKFKVLFTTGDSLARLYACVNNISNICPSTTSNFPSVNYCESNPLGMVYYSENINDEKIFNIDIEKYIEEKIKEYIEELPKDEDNIKKDLVYAFIYNIFNEKISQITNNYDYIVRFYLYNKFIKKKVTNISHLNTYELFSLLKINQEFIDFIDRYIESAKKPPSQFTSSNKSPQSPQKTIPPPLSPLINLPPLSSPPLSPSSSTSSSPPSSSQPLSSTSSTISSPPPFNLLQSNNYVKEHLNNLDKVEESRKKISEKLDTNIISKSEYAKITSNKAVIISQSTSMPENDEDLVPSTFAKFIDYHDTESLDLDKAETQPLYKNDNSSVDSRDEDLADTQLLNNNDNRSVDSRDEDLADTQLLNNNSNNESVYSFKSAKSYLNKIIDDNDEVLSNPKVVQNLVIQLPNNPYELIESTMLKTPNSMNDDEA